MFQTQLEKLQDGDRLYYLARTPGMNLRTQLEGNSFAEMIQRNTDNTNTLKADAFATADCKFQLGNVVSPAPAGFAIIGQGSVADDLTTPDCNENLLLLQQPDGTIQYRARNIVDPPGINGQAVYNGTDGADRVIGGNDNDTFWGGDGNDIIEGNGGDDVALGGEGNDIITDLDGADVPKGGPGQRLHRRRPGRRHPDGQRRVRTSSTAARTTTSRSPARATTSSSPVRVPTPCSATAAMTGSRVDPVRTSCRATTARRSSTTRPRSLPGNDIFVGQVGENDYDAEGGDDLMAQNAAIDRNAGAGGFDWAFHQYDTVGADDDMEINNNLVGVPIQVVVNRDRWQETEADSGSAFNDVIRGTEDVPERDRRRRLHRLRRARPRRRRPDRRAERARHHASRPRSRRSRPSRPPAAARSPGSPTATDPRGNVWAEGDILLGGAGSDSITGRGADDIIDGDRSLQVRISVRAGVDPATGTPAGPRSPAPT